MQGKVKQKTRTKSEAGSEEKKRGEEKKQNKK